jgi:hypothetical protein
MEDRFRWIKHNPHEVVPTVPADKESAYCWAAYNPFQHPGVIAKEFIEAKGNLSGLIKFRNLTEGLPFIRQGASIKEDDLDRVVARTPIRYVQGQIPLEAELLTMTIDRQDEQFWFVIRAWGILWDHPEWPTWSALVDWGEAVSWTQLLERGGLAPNESGRIREFQWKCGTRNAEGGIGETPSADSLRTPHSEFRIRKYVVTAGLADSGDGDHTKDVYEFCLANREVFSPYKGGDQSKTLGNPIRISPIMDKEIDLIWAWSDFFADNLYFDCIKHGNIQGTPVHWWLPANIDAHYREQLTDEYRGEVNGKKSYISRQKKNHLGDGEKMQRAMAPSIEERFNELRDERLAEIDAKEKEDADAD